VYGGLPGTPDDIRDAAAVGLVEVQLQLHGTFHTRLDDPVVALQQRAELRRDAEGMFAFVTAARSWWATLLEEQPACRGRVAKARRESGREGLRGKYNADVPVNLTCLGCVPCWHRVCERLKCDADCVGALLRHGCLVATLQLCAEPSAVDIQPHAIQLLPHCSR